MPEPLTLTEGQDFTLTRLASPEVGDTIVPAATFGIMLCSGGEASAHIGSHAHRLCRGSLAVLFPYSLFTFDSRGSDFDGWFVEINVSLLISTMASLPIADRLAIRQRACVKLPDEEYGRLASVLSVMEGHAAPSAPPPQGTGLSTLSGMTRRALAGVAISEALAGVLRQTGPGDSARTDTMHETFNRFILSLAKNGARERSVAGYAAEASMTPNYFSSYIKRVSGRTATHWIRLVAITMARHYLSSTTMNVKEIAYAMGFPDQSTFGRYFKSACGMSPADFRSSVRAGRKA